MMEVGQHHLQENDKFSEKYHLHLLHTIHYSLSLDDLIKLGLEYNQIAQLLSEVIKEGFVKDSDEGLILTDKGLVELRKLINDVYSSNSHKWILPLAENRIPKIGKYDIYLPKKNKV